MKKQRTPEFKYKALRQWLEAGKALFDISSILFPDSECVSFFGENEVTQRTFSLHEKTLGLEKPFSLAKACLTCALGGRGLGSLCCFILSCGKWRD